MGTPKVTPITEIRHAWGFLVWDPEDGITTRAQIILAQGYGANEAPYSSDDFETAGLVLGQFAEGAISEAAGSNTGNGVFTGLQSLAGAPVGAYAMACTQATAGAGAATVQAHEGNVGTGAVGAVTVGAAAQVGAYRLELTATGATAAFDVFNPENELVGQGHVATLFNAGGLSFTLANAGTMTAGDSYDIIVSDNGVALFSLTDPNGKALPTVTVGTAYANEVGFTLGQGSAKFIVGDSFTITIAAGSGLYAPFDPTALNGLQNAVAILGSYRKDTTSAQQQAGALVRGPARVNASELIWGANVTTNAQQNAALAQLAALGILSTPSTLTGAIPTS
jgi:hypothetical protein